MIRHFHDAARVDTLFSAMPLDDEMPRVICQQPLMPLPMLLPAAPF